jgi:hypothetical protein
MVNSLPFWPVLFCLKIIGKPICQSKIGQKIIKKGNKECQV